jgi:hypothetical protein
MVQVIHQAINVQRVHEGPEASPTETLLYHRHLFFIAVLIANHSQQIIRRAAVAVSPAEHGVAQLTIQARYG